MTKPFRGVVNVDVTQSGNGIGTPMVVAPPSFTAGATPPRTTS